MSYLLVFWYSDGGLTVVSKQSKDIVELHEERNTLVLRWPRLGPLQGKILLRAGMYTYNSAPPYITRTVSSTLLLKQKIQLKPTKSFC